MLYLGEINSSQELAWRKSIEVLDDDAPTAAPRTYALFPEDRYEAVLPDESIVRLKLKSLQLHRPRQWGACWDGHHGRLAGKNVYRIPRNLSASQGHPRPLGCK